MLLPYFLYLAIPFHVKPASPLYPTGITYFFQISVNILPEELFILQIFYCYLSTKVINSLLSLINHQYITFYFLPFLSPYLAHFSIVFLLVLLF